MRHQILTSSGTLQDAIESNRYSPPPNVALTNLDIAPHVIEMLPESVARESLIFPLHFDGETLSLAVQDADDIMLQDQLRFMLNCNIAMIPRSAKEITEAIDSVYGVCESESVDSMLREFDDLAFDESLADFEMGFAAPDQSKREVRRKRKFTRPENVSRFAGRKGMIFYTVSEGQKVLAYQRNGKIDVLTGPHKVFRGLTCFEPMQRFVAHPGQYMSIQFVDGREETRLGPTEEWMDPRNHKAIDVHDCLDLAAKEAVVVYGKQDVISEENPATTRRIFYGPGLFVPSPGEWLHTFSWHASQGGSRGAEKRPGALKFQKMCLMPDQMYHDVRDVRTADDAVLTIRLMIFFELADIEKMLDTTRDPIGDFINAATSDVVEFTGKRNFDDFKQNTEQLNEIATYHQLLHRAQQCGYKINNVVYRGYGAPDSLQAMHDEAIATRTRLQLDKATERQAQELEDYKLSCQMDRATRRREEQLAEVQHDLEMKRQRSEAELTEKQRQGEFSRQQQSEEQRQALELKQQQDLQQQSHLKQLAGLGVELTEYLTQARADQIIELRGASSSAAPQLHMDNRSRKEKTTNGKR